MKYIPFFFFLLSPIFQGCEQKVIRPTSHFNPQEMELASKAGSSSIAGQAFMKTQAGDVKYAAGNTISLLPLTPYVEQTLSLIDNKEPFTQIDFDKRIYDYAKKTVADGNGKFKFSNLSPGRYYMETDIVWMYPTQYGLQETGGTVKGVATITNDGENTEVILHSNPRADARR